MGIISMVKVRAVIYLGNSITCATPDTENYPDGIIQSFNVSKSRGKPSTFNATLKVKYDVMDRNILGDVKIDAGVEGSLNRIFTGMVRSAKTSPCNDDPSYIILNVSGVDILGKLDGMKYTRRQRGSKACWVTIDGVSRKGLKSGKFGYQNIDTIITVDTDLNDSNQKVDTITTTEGVYMLAPEALNSNAGSGKVTVEVQVVNEEPENTP